MKQWTDEAMKQWFSEPMMTQRRSDPEIQWIIERMNQSTGDLVRRWVDESMTEQSMNQWIREPHWVHESLIQRINEAINQWTKERPLRWGTSSLSYFFPEQPLIWASSALGCFPAKSFAASATQFNSSLRTASTVRFATSSRNPEKQKSRTMVKNYLSRSCYTAFTNFQLHSRITGASQHHTCSPARSRANAFCRKPSANPHSRSVATNRPTFAERWHGVRATPIPSFSAIFMWHRALATPVHFLRTSSSKMLRTHQVVYILKCKPSSRHSPVHFLSTTFPDRAADPRKQRPLPVNRQSFAPESVFTREFTSSRTVPFPNYLMIGGWHSDAVDMMKEMLTMTVVRNSEVLWLNFLWHCKLPYYIIYIHAHCKHTYIHAYMHACMHTYKHTYIDR